MGVKGIPELNQGIEDVLKTLDPDTVEAIALDAARIISTEIKALAPQGSTGNLKKSIVAKILQRSNPIEPAPAIVAINFRRGPHAHLVEKGTAPRTQKTTGRFVGSMPAHPFFMPGYEAKKDAAMELIINRLGSMIEGAW